MGSPFSEEEQEVSRKFRLLAMENIQWRHQRNKLQYKMVGIEK